MVWLSKIWEIISMTLMQQLKEGILTGNWDIICSVYSSATGEVISPPEQTKIEEVVFDHKTAKKKDLYKWIKDNYDIKLKSITSYKVQDLRDIAQFNIDMNGAQEPISQQEVQSTTGGDPLLFNSDYAYNGSAFYINGEATARDRNMANSLKNINERIKADKDIKGLLDTEENNEYAKLKSYREKYEPVEATCKQCNQVVKVHPAKITTLSDVDNKKLTVCEYCMGR